MEGEDHSCFALLPLCAPWAFLWVPSAMLTLPPCLCLQGIINLGTSENKLCFDLLSRRVSPMLLSVVSQVPSALGLPQNASLTRAWCSPEARRPGFQICLGGDFLCYLGQVPSLFPPCFMKTSSHTQCILLAGPLLAVGSTQQGVVRIQHPVLGKEDSDLWPLPVPTV